MPVHPTKNDLSLVNCKKQSSLSYPPTRLGTNTPTWQNPESMTDSRRTYTLLGMPHVAGQVSPERLEEFKRIYKKAYGEDITIAEAREMTHRLLALYNLVMRPLPKEGENVSSSPPPPSSPDQTVLEES
jgi:hypothetical protein